MLLAAPYRFLDACVGGEILTTGCLPGPHMCPPQMDVSEAHKAYPAANVDAGAVSVYVVPDAHGSGADIQALTRDLRC